MSYEGWAAVCAMGIILALVVSALHKQNQKVDALFFEKAKRAKDRGQT